MSTEFVSGMLAQRRRRAVADVMGSLERGPAWPLLGKDDQAAVRSSVVGAINGYHDVALDLFRVVTDGHVIVSQEAMAMLRDLHDDLVHGDD